MRMTSLFAATLYEDPTTAELISHKLMLRAGLIKVLASGIYTHLPLGNKVIQKICEIVRQELNKIEGQEVILPILHPAEIWQETKRWDEYGEEMFKLTDRKKRYFGLGPTHEEIITDLVRKEVKSYRQLPFMLYQIQTKFRDEIRPRFGVMRAREFIMKDAYSFHINEEDLNCWYKKLYQAYSNIFTRCGVNYIVVEADPGLIGGSMSHEFMVISDSGEEPLVICKNCNYSDHLDQDLRKAKEGDSCVKCGQKLQFCKGIEVGHIFKLGQKYSKVMRATFRDEDGQEKIIVMGCYGIGITRMVAAAIEQSHDKNGIIWPKAIAPYQILVLPVNVTDPEISAMAEDMYNCLIDKGFEVLIDDRNESPGRKFKDADLIGIPFRITIGNKAKEDKTYEVMERGKREKKFLSKDELLEEIHWIFKLT